MASFPCFKCNGAGQVSFKHIENGVCFACGGTGKLDYKPRPKVEADPHPEWLVPENKRGTMKQWDYLVRLCGDVDKTICETIKNAGGRMATLRYLTKETMSKAIELARKSRAH
jgi:hypothetical protein